MRTQEYLAPRSVDAALQALAADAYTILAGGTDIYPAYVGKPEPRLVLDISTISELRGISSANGWWKIGANTTWSDLVTSKLPIGFRCLQEAAKQIGGVQVQNAGTIAGNLCTASPAGDSIPALLALDAEIELRSLHKSRRMPLHDFIIGYRKTICESNEIVSNIYIPEIAAQGVSSFEKFGTRSYLVISLAMVAVSIRRDVAGRLNDLRIAVGACSPVAIRLHDLEKRLVKERISAESVYKINLDDVSTLTPIDDIRCTAAYRSELVRVLIRRALERAGWNS